MKHPHTFIISVAAGLTGFCTAATISMTPVETNKGASAAGFAFFAAMAAASATLTAAAVADGLTVRR